MKSKQAFVFRFLALVISVLLVFGALPVSALDGEEATEYGTETVVTEEPTIPEVQTETESPTESEEIDIAPIGEEEETQPATEDPQETPTELTTEVPTEMPTEPDAVLKDGYYLIGEDWTINSIKENHMFVDNPGSSGEFMLKVKLEKGKGIKVVKIEDGKIPEQNAWFPEGMDNEYVVDKYHAGNTIIYFRNSYQNNDDWKPFGGYMYIKPTIVDDGEGEKDNSIAEDTVKPVLTIDGYSNDDDKGEQQWVNGDTPVSVFVTATDEGNDGQDSWGLNLNSFKKNGARVKATPVQGSASKYEIVLSEAGKAKKAEADLTVADYAENVSATVTTEPLKIDNLAPKSSDVISGVFEKKQPSAAEQVLNLLTFKSQGLYSNGELTFTITVSPKDGSPITEINLVDGNAPVPVDKATPVPVKDNEGNYYQTFILSPKNEAYDLKINSIQDEVGNTTPDPFSITDIPLSANDQGVKEIQSLYELVSTYMIPEVKYQISGTLNNNVYEGNITIDTTVTDRLSGLVGDSEVAVYFDTADKFTESSSKNPEGKDIYVYDCSKAKKVTDFTVNTSELGSEELSGKLIKKQLQFSIPDTTKTNAYAVVTVAKNNSGNMAYKKQDVYIDNAAPTIGEEFSAFYLDKDNEIPLESWTKKQVKVKFTASDDADSFGMGIHPEKIVITGSVNNNSYIAEKVVNADNTYSFLPDLYQDYKIVVADDFGHSFERILPAEKVLFDDEKPKISDVQYDGENYDSQKWKKAEDGVVVSFRVTDISDKVKVDNKDIWLSGREKIDIKVVDENENIVSVDTISQDVNDGYYAYEFTSYSYQKYRIVAIDAAGNPSDETTTEKTNVDSEAPEITEVSFSEDSSATDAILNFLTFGIYSNHKIEMTVKVTDNPVSSGIRDIKAFYDGDSNKPIDAKDKNVINGASNDKEAVIVTKSFVLKEDDIIDGHNIIVSAEDNALYSTGDKSLYDLNKQGEQSKIVTDENGNVKLGEYFEIVGSNTGATIGDLELTSKVTDKETYIDSNNGYKWFPGDVEAQFSVEDNVTKIHSVVVTLNKEHNITKYCKDDYGELDDAVPEEYSHWNVVESGDKVDKLTVRFDTSDPEIAKHLNRTGDSENSDGKNTVDITVTSNNGKEITKETQTFYIDNTIPKIDKIEFVDGNGEEPGNTVKTTYGYYFQEETTVYVTASDKGSGVRDVRLVGTSINHDYDTADYGPKTVELNKLTGEGDTAQFTIPAGFKGQIAAYAYDNVANRSLDYNPDGVIVESEKTHKLKEVSDATITVNTNSVGTDNNGIDLYNGDVSVSFDIKDMYSGLKEVSYRIIDTAHPDPEFILLNTEKTAAGDAYVGDWRIANSESNLAYRLTNTITVSATEHNDNNVKIQLKGIDRAGFPIEQVEKEISIDITKPTVKVVYSPAIDSAFHRNDNYYFNKVRTATITVTERNFNPNDFDLSKYIAIEGTRPDLVGTSNWSTSYALVNASGEEQRTAEHTAEITFSQDGKYEVDFDYTDLAGNAANKDFQKETFYIDMTKPVMTVSLDNNASPRYYQSNRATIKIVEHNFDPSAEYLVYDASATGPDNVSPATPPQISSWSSSGDEHTATINYDDSNQGKHNFKITYKDLADNAADDHTEDTFYIDHTANKPTFENVTRKAYSGNIAPIVQFDDYNFNEAPAGSVITLTRHAYDFDKMQQLTDKVEYTNTRSIKYASNSDAIGATVTYANFDKKEIVDGIYNLNASYTDKAGNEASDSITFSVNRFGSVFVLGSAQTTSLVDMVYTKDAPDVVIREISAVPHINGAASLSYNSSNKDLNEKSNEYKVSSPNSAGEWYEYMYQIFASNFEKEGEYTVTVSSKYKIDEKETTVTNRTADTSGDVERNCPVSFVVDKTSPTVSITGVDENGFYSEAEKTLHIVCSDDNIDKDSLSITLDGHAVNLEESKAVVDDSLFGELDIELPIAADGHETKHSIKVDVKDYALNSGDNAVNAFTLSATFLTMFFHNTVALIVTGGVLAALIALAVILVVKKRKNSTN